MNTPSKALMDSLEDSYNDLLKNMTQYTSHNNKALNLLKKAVDYPNRNWVVTAVSLRQVWEVQRFNKYNQLNRYCLIFPYTAGDSEAPTADDAIVYAAREDDSGMLNLYCVPDSYADEVLIDKTFYSVQKRLEDSGQALLTKRENWELTQTLHHFLQTGKLRISVEYLNFGGKKNIRDLAIKAFIRKPYAPGYTVDVSTKQKLWKSQFDDYEYEGFFVSYKEKHITSDPKQIMNTIGLKLLVQEIYGAEIYKYITLTPSRNAKTWDMCKALELEKHFYFFRTLESKPTGKKRYERELALGVTPLIETEGESDE